MGQAADDLTEGLVCSWCGTYFAKPHGHPVLCRECWSWTSKAEHAEISQATIAELCGETQDGGE